MTIRDITNYLEEVFPLENALGFDNVGLLAGGKDASCSKVVLCLDATNAAVDYASSVGAKLIVSHHPLIFGGINNIVDTDANGRILLSLIKKDISLYACHTNLDITDEFGNLAIAEALGGINASHLDGTECGVVFDIAENNFLLGEYALFAKKALSSSGVISISDQNRRVTKVFAQGGAFDEDSVPAVLSSGVDTVISGEIKHHICVLLEEYGVSTLILGHSATEQVYLPKLKNILEKKFPDVEFFVFLNNEKEIN